MERKNVDYKKNYYDYINYVKTLNRKLDYSEKHHIIPRCLGGSNDKSNLVVLTAREHFLAHYLLTKIYPDNYKLVDAFRMMGVINKKEQNRYINSRLYESKKKLFSEARSKKVLCIETGEVFPSAAYVEKNIVGGIRDVIYGKHLTAGGYHWKYLYEDNITKEPYERKKVICANTGEIFDNTDKAAKFAGVNPSLIRGLCNGTRGGTAKGYTFYYYNKKENYSIREVREGDYKVKRIKCMETEKIYNNAVEAGKQFNSSSAARFIRQCCKGLIDTYKGFHWRFV